MRIKKWAIYFRHKKLHTERDFFATRTVQDIVTTVFERFYVIKTIQNRDKLIFMWISFNDEVCGYDH